MEKTETASITVFLQGKEKLKILKNFLPWGGGEGKRGP
jgi:hypothetical protein